MPVYNGWMQALIIFSVALLVPIIMHFLNKHLEKEIPATKKTSERIMSIIKKIKKNKLLKKRIDKHYTASALLGIATVVVLNMILFFWSHNKFELKYGDNSIIYMLPLVVLFSSTAVIMLLVWKIASKFFLIRNPDTTSELFDIYTTYCTPGGALAFSPKIDALSLSRKMFMTSIAVLLPTLMLILFFIYL
jgi:hypothetical protein